MFLYNTFATTLQQYGYKVIPDGMQYNCIKNDLYITISRIRIIVRKYEDRKNIGRRYRFIFDEGYRIFRNDLLITPRYAEDLFCGLNKFDQLPMRMNMLDIKLKLLLL